MRLVVVSDTHRHFDRLHKVVKRHLETTDWFIHLGDGLREMDDLCDLYPQLPLLSVCGNCDMMRMEPYERIFHAPQHKILLCHGHSYGVKRGLQELKLQARKQQCTMALFGHTHKAVSNYEDGLYTVNPGSLGSPVEGKPTYALIDLVNNRAVISIVEV